MRLTEWQRVTIANAMGNYAKNSGASDDYCKGMIVGLVSGVCAFRRVQFADIMGAVLRQMPDNYRQITADNMPEDWLQYCDLLAMVD